MARCAQAMRGRPPQLVVLGDVDRIGGRRPAPQVDPLVLGHAEAIGGVGRREDDGGREVDVHDRHQPLGVRVGHHPVLGGDVGQLGARPLLGEPGVGVGRRDLRHRGEEVAERLPVLGRRRGRGGPDGPRRGGRRSSTPGRARRATSAGWNGASNGNGFFSGSRCDHAGRSPAFLMARTWARASPPTMAQTSDSPASIRSAAPISSCSGVVPPMPEYARAGRRCPHRLGQATGGIVVGPALAVDDVERVDAPRDPRPSRAAPRPTRPAARPRTG